MSKCVIKKKPKTDNMFIVTYELTRGELMALENGLCQYSENSMVGKDVFEYTQNALTEIK
jgi:hypothetical protein